MGIRDTTGTVVTPLSEIIANLTTALGEDFESIAQALEEELKETDP